MIWDVISFVSRPHLVLVVISCTVTAQLYDDKILQLVMLLFLFQHRGFAFEHENSRPHTALVALDFFQAFSILPWPSWLPYFSPKEHI